MKSQDDTVAVMVVYEPPESVINAVEALLPQVKALVIVDNAANNELKPLLGDRVIWLQSAHNNLGAAQNLGIAKARELGAEFVLLMDDDSLPAPEMVPQLRAAWRESIGVIGPYMEEPALGRAPLYLQPCAWGWFKRAGFHSLPAKSSAELNNLYYLCASGSLVPLSAIDSIGGMNEHFGLYFIDTEFCLRARKAGYDVVAVKAARLTHRVGNRSEHIVLGKRISTTNHSAQARYLMCRNRKFLWKWYLTSDTGYVVFDILRLMSEMLRVLLFEQHKRQKLAAMCRGLCAAISSQGL